MLRGQRDLLSTGLIIITLLIITQKTDAEVYLNLLNTPWQFANVTEWDQRTCSFDVVNATNQLRKTEGLRFTVPNKPTTFVSYDNPAVDVTAVNDGNGADRYTARISGMNTNGTAFLNAINANTSLRVNLTCSGIQAGTDFTPVKHQYLVKTGSITGDKGYKDAPPISVDIIDSLIALPWTVCPRLSGNSGWHLYRRIYRYLVRSGGRLVTLADSNRSTSRFLHSKR